MSNNKPAGAGERKRKKAGPSMIKTSAVTTATGFPLALSAAIDELRH
jgi:hypothetical protein